MKRLWISVGFTALLLPGHFAPRNTSLPGVNQPIEPWPIRSLELSLSGPFAPWPTHSQALLFPGTFAPRSEMTQELSFPRTCIPYAHNIDMQFLTTLLQGRCVHWARSGHGPTFNPPGVGQVRPGSVVFTTVASVKIIISTSWILHSIIIASDRQPEVTLCETDSVRSCVTTCCEAAQ